MIVGLALARKNCTTDGDESVIRNYFKNQGSDAKYMKLHDSNQLMIFE